MIVLINHMDLTAKLLLCVQSIHDIKNISSSSLFGGPIIGPKTKSRKQLVYVQGRPRSEPLALAVLEGQSSS